MILTPLQKLPKNGGDWGKLIVAKGFKSFPKSNKSPNLVTLLETQQQKKIDGSQIQWTIEIVKILRFARIPFSLS